eukprot:TRINITY_DN2505_c0_g1_i1.p1 TRINITY_DN2505_c0_g1~~TRINITY_DN2505_c0_g1_i1.p1  ORF type:complete len:604 (-),score=71.44 TRINITY_DN2505_c0_g1_i1:386-2197(-)
MINLRNLRNSKFSQSLVGLDERPKFLRFQSMKSIKEVEKEELLREMEMLHVKQRDSEQICSVACELLALRSFMPNEFYSDLADELINRELQVSNVQQIIRDFRRENKSLSPLIIPQKWGLITKASREESAILLEKVPRNTIETQSIWFGRVKTYLCDIFAKWMVVNYPEVEDHKVRIISCGSLVLGESTNKSDLDLLVIFPDGVDLAGLDSILDVLDNDMFDPKGSWVCKSAFSLVYLKKCRKKNDIDGGNVRMNVLVGSELQNFDFDFDDQHSASAILKKMGSPNDRHIFNRPRDVRLINRLLGLHTCQFAVQNYIDALRCIKYWAKRRGIYGKGVGFLNGISVALMVLFATQSLIETSVSGITRAFFKLFSSWDYDKIYTTLPHGKDLGIEDNELFGGRNHKSEGISIFTPTHPFVNCFNVSEKQLEIIKSEICRAEVLLQKHPLEIVYAGNDQLLSKVLQAETTIKADDCDEFNVVPLSDESEREFDVADFLFTAVDFYHPGFGLSYIQIAISMLKSEAYCGNVYGSEYIEGGLVRLLKNLQFLPIIIPDPNAVVTPNAVYYFLAFRCDQCDPIAQMRKIELALCDFVEFLAKDKGDFSL